MKYLLVLLILPLVAIAQPYDLEVDWTGSSVPSNLTKYEMVYAGPDGQPKRLIIEDPNRRTFTMLADSEGEYRFAFVGIATFDNDDYYCTEERVVVYDVAGFERLPPIDFTVRRINTGAVLVPPCNGDCEVVDQ